jgi:hypothetical protein
MPQSAPDSLRGNDRRGRPSQPPLIPAASIFWSSNPMVLHIRTVPFRNDPASPDGPEPGQLIQPFFEHLPIPGLTVDVELAAPGIIRCYGHVGFQMEGENRDETVAITLSAWLDGKRIQPGYAAGQNGIRRQHYRDVPFIWAETVDAGPHQVQMRARVSDDLPVFYRPRQYTRMHVEVSEPDNKCTERPALLRVRARRLALAHRSRWHRTIRRVQSAQRVRPQAAGQAPGGAAARASVPSRLRLTGSVALVSRRCASAFSAFAAAASADGR